MTDMGMIGGVAASLRLMGDITKLAIEARDIALMREKVIELSTVIMSAQSSAIAAQMDQFALLDRVRKLEEQIAGMKAWNAEKQRYELQRVHTGAFAYALKPEAQGSEPPHWICATCYEKGRRSVLQRASSQRSGEWPFMCTSCKAVIYVSQGPEQQLTRPARAPGDTCPKCGELEFRIESSAPDPTFGDLGVSLRRMNCGACGFTEGRQHRG